MKRKCASNTEVLILEIIRVNEKTHEPLLNEYVIIKFGVVSSNHIIIQTRGSFHHYDKLNPKANDINYAESQKCFLRSLGLQDFIVNTAV